MILKQRLNKESHNSPKKKSNENAEHRGLNRARNMMLPLAGAMMYAMGGINPDNAINYLQQDLVDPLLDFAPVDRKEKLVHKQPKKEKVELINYDFGFIRNMELLVNPKIQPYGGLREKDKKFLHGMNNKQEQNEKQIRYVVDNPLLLEDIIAGKEQEPAVNPYHVNKPYGFLNIFGFQNPYDLGAILKLPKEEVPLQNIGMVVDRPDPVEIKLPEPKPEPESIPDPVWTGETSEEVLREILGLVDLPDISADVGFYYSVGMGTYKQRKEIAAKLYSCDIKSIKSIKKDRKFGYGTVNHFFIDFKNGVKSDFYLKKNWEGSVVSETLGNTLAYILTKGHLPKTTYSFIGCEENKTCASTGISATTFKHKGEDFSDQAAFNYGVAIELSRALGLTDRHDQNIMIADDDMVIPIDFGTLFRTSSTSEYSCSHEEPANAEMVKAGRQMGLEMITKNYEQNKGVIHQLIAYAHHKNASFTHKPEESIDSYVSAHRRSMQE